MLQAGEAQRKPVAFVHMRWEKDDTEGWPVLYCYDIQLEPCVQRKGLGRCAEANCSPDYTFGLSYL